MRSSPEAQRSRAGPGRGRAGRSCDVPASTRLRRWARRRSRHPPGDRRSTRAPLRCSCHRPTRSGRAPGPRPQTGPSRRDGELRTAVARRPLAADPQGAEAGTRADDDRIDERLLAGALHGLARTLDPHVQGYLSRLLDLRIPAVRIHTGQAADATARRFNADAVSLRPAASCSEPASSRPTARRGLGLLGHELTHVAHAAAPSRTDLPESPEPRGARPGGACRDRERKARAAARDRQPACAATIAAVPREPHPARATRAPAPRAAAVDRGVAPPRPRAALSSASPELSAATARRAQGGDLSGSDGPDPHRIRTRSVIRNGIGQGDDHQSGHQRGDSGPVQSRRVHAGSRQHDRGDRHSGRAEVARSVRARQCPHAQDGAVFRHLRAERGRPRPHAAASPRSWSPARRPWPRRCSCSPGAACSSSACWKRSRNASSCSSPAACRCAPASPSRSRSLRGCEVEIERGFFVGPPTVRNLVEGETLSKLAHEYLGDPGAWRDIAEANGIDDPINLRPGRRIVIPLGSDEARDLRPVARHAFYRPDFADQDRGSDLGGRRA